LEPVGVGETEGHIGCYFVGGGEEFALPGGALFSSLSHGLFAECFVVDFGGFIFSWSLADKLVFAQATAFFIFELF